MSSTALAPRAPLAPGLPLFGSALDAYRDPCRLFHRCYERSGPVFRVRYPGRELLVLAGPEANALFAGDSGERFDTAATYRRVSRELGTTQYPSPHDGEPHRVWRQRLAPSFSAPALEPFLPKVAEHVLSVARAWTPGSRPLSASVGPLVADAAAIATCNRPLGAALASDGALYGTMIGMVGVGGAFPEFTLYTPPVQRAKRRLLAFAREVLEHHRSQPPTLRRDPDYFDALLAIEGEAAGRLPPEALAALALLPMKNAGIYLYRLVSFVLWELLARPEWMAAAREEADHAFAAGLPNGAALASMERLSRVVHECLRLYPMAIALPRVVRAPFEFSGFAFAPGQEVYFAGPVTHYLPACFTEPERFDPNRFLPGRDEHKRPHTFAPFGLGPHACMARGFSLALSTLVVAALIHALELAPVEAGSPPPVKGLPVPIPEARFALDVRGVRRAERVKRRESPSAAVPALAALTAEEQRAVAQGLRDVRLEPGTVLYMEGEPAEHLYVVREGSVELLADGRVHAKLGKGAHFGDIGLFQGSKRPTGARVAGTAPARLITVSREAAGLLAMNGERSLTEIVALIQRRQVVGRLAAALPNLKVERLARLGADGDSVRLPPGAVVCREGDPSTQFWVLAEGAVEVVKAGAPGDGVVARLEAPDCFGEIGLLERVPRTATVRVASGRPALLIAFGERAFTVLAADSTGTGADLIRLATDRLQALSDATES